MTIEQAIEHAEDIAVSAIGCECREEHRQLAEWLRELQERRKQPEKAQLSQQGTTKDAISKTETVGHLRRVLEATVPNTDYDEGYIDGIEFGISTVSTMSTIQPEPSIPLSWIEKFIEWLKSLDNEFANLAAADIDVMVERWRSEQNERTD